MFNFFRKKKTSKRETKKHNDLYTQAMAGMSEDKENTSDLKTLVEKAKKAKSLEEVVDLFSDAIQIEKEKSEPNTIFISDIYNKRGEIYLSQGVAVLSSSDFSQAIEYNPKNAEAHNNLGMWFTIEHFMQPDYKRALEHFEMAVKFSSNRPDILMNRAIMYIRNNQKEVGKKELEKLIQNGYTEAQQAIERFCQ